MRDDMKKKIPGNVLKGTVMALLAVSLGACQGNQAPSRAAAKEKGIFEGLQIADIAGMLQTAPDEFSVVTKRPLEMPDSFAALPRPDPGAPSTRDPDPLADARAALAIAPAAARSTGTSASETALLASVGTADPSIRATLASERAAEESGEKSYLLDRLFPRLRELRGETDVEAIDAEAERQRLLEAGIGPGRAAAPPPPLAAAGPLPATPLDPGTGPALSGPGYDAPPTLGIPAPDPSGTVPPLIYLPE